jgi:ABC-2 type transport system permease protein
MNWSVVRAVIAKDLRIAYRNRGVRIPLVVTPLLLVVVVPSFLILGVELLGAGGLTGMVTEGQATGPFGGLVPSVVQAAGDSPLTYERAVLEYLVVPLYLLVPLVVATVIAADSFAGERERRTLEALLHTATSDRELFIGKLLGAYLPAVASSWIAFAVYSIIANLLGSRSMGGIFFPTPAWLVIALWVAPAVALLNIGLMVGVSSRVRSLQAAHQIGSLLVLPFILILVVQITGVMLVDLSAMLLFGLILWFGAGAVLLVNLVSFERDSIASRM